MTTYTFTKEQLLDLIAEAKNEGNNEGSDYYGTTKALSDQKILDQFLYEEKIDENK